MSYPAGVGTLAEDARGGANDGSWDVIDLVEQDKGYDGSIYGFSIEGKVKKGTRNNPQRTHLGDAESIQWFWEVHVDKHSKPPKWVKGIILYGNEDSPERAELFDQEGMDDVSVGPRFKIDFMS
jgi:hypothetical protein